MLTRVSGGGRETRKGGGGSDADKEHQSRKRGGDEGRRRLGGGRGMRESIGQEQGRVGSMTSRQVPDNYLVFETLSDLWHVGVNVCTMAIFGHRCVLDKYR